MENKVAVILAIIAIVCGLTSLGISIYNFFDDDLEEDQEFDLEEILTEGDKVCYMPRDCFDEEKEYLNQFENQVEPKYFRECLIYCYK